MGRLCASRSRARNREATPKLAPGEHVGAQDGYNQRNDQLYDELVGRGARIERELGLPGGAFANRPRAWLRALGVWPINHRWPVALIYGASTSLWLYSAAAAAVQLLRGDKQASRPELAICAGGSLVAVVLLGGVLTFQRKRRRERLRTRAHDAVEAALERLDPQQAQESATVAAPYSDFARLAEDCAFVSTCARLSAPDGPGSG
jgi:hypothetical protein